VLPLLKYTVLRLALFVASMGVLYLLGMRGLLNVAVAALISLMLSYVLLRRPREDLSQAIAGRISRRLADPSERRTPLGLDDDAAAEDAALDAVALADNPPPPGVASASPADKPPPRADPPSAAG
jgi:hypothetical protein